MKKQNLSRILKLSKVLFILAGFILLDSCSSGKKALERGNYYESVMQSVNRLQRNADHKKSRATLKVSYPLAVDYYETEIGNLEARQDREKWRGIVEAYGRINNMYEAIRRSPGALEVIPNPKNYYDQLAEANTNAAEESYQFGVAELNKGTRESGRTAYMAFQDADHYVSGYRNVNEMMELAYWAGTVKVLVTPIPVTSARYQLSADFFEDKIHEALKNEPVDQFVRFLTQSELESFNVAPDHVLKLQFDEFTIGEVHTVERQIDQRKDSVKVGSVDASGLVSNYVDNRNSGGDGSGGINTKTTSGTDTGSDTNSSGKTRDTNTTTSGTTTTNTNQNTQSNTNTSTGSGSDTGQNTAETTEETVETEEVAEETTESSNQGNAGQSGGNDSAAGASAERMIDICHKTGDDSRTISVAESAVKGHLSHGDKILGCDAESNERVRICHKTAAGTSSSLVISINAVQAHLDHGDELGGCDGSDYRVSNGNGRGGGGAGYGALLPATAFEKTLLAGNGLSDEFYAELYESPAFAADTNIDVYQDVRATVYIFEKTVRSYGTLDFRILDANTGAVLSAEKLSGEFVWMSQWGYFNGDERALTEEQLQIVNQRELPPPPEQDLFIGITQPIYSQLMSKLRSYYR